MANHITITPVSETVTVKAGGVKLGSSQQALELKEGGYPSVVYVPRQDIDLALLARTNRESTCPWKGLASYYSIVTPTGTFENAVWSYEAPKPEMAAIAGFMAFYTDRVEVTRG